MACECTIAVYVAKIIVVSVYENDIVRINIVSKMLLRNFLLHHSSAPSK